MQQIKSVSQLQTDLYVSIRNNTHAILIHPIDGSFGGTLSGEMQWKVCVAEPDFNVNLMAHNTPSCYPQREAFTFITAVHGMVLLGKDWSNRCPLCYTLCYVCAGKT